MNYLVDLTKSYSQMLFKIAISTTLATLLSLWVLGQAEPRVAAFLGQWKVSFKAVGDVTIPLGFVIAALAAGVLSRMFTLHDRLSDVFRIRASFDVKHILIPLSEGVGINVDKKSAVKLRTNRRKLMGSCFYTYVGYEDPKVDKHLVAMALDAWTHYWMMLEALFVGTILLGILVYFKDFVYAKYTMYAVLAFTGFLLLLGLRCRSRALSEVEAILRDPAQCQAVRMNINAVLH